MVSSQSSHSAAGLLWNPGRYWEWRRAAAESVTHFYLSREKEGRREGNGGAAAPAQTKSRHRQPQQEAWPNTFCAVSVCTVLSWWQRIWTVLQCSLLVHKPDMTAESPWEWIQNKSEQTGSWDSGGSVVRKAFISLAEQHAIKKLIPLLALSLSCCLCFTSLLYVWKLSPATVVCPDRRKWISGPKSWQWKEAWYRLFKRGVWLLEEKRDWFTFIHPRAIQSLQSV